MEAAAELFTAVLWNAFLDRMNLLNRYKTNSWVLQYCKFADGVHPGALKDCSV